MMYAINILGYTFEIQFESHWDKSLKGTRKRYIELSFCIQDLRIP